MSNHPNATAAGLAGAIAIILVWVLGIFGVDMPDEVAAAVTGVLTTLVLIAGGKKTAA